MASADDLLLSQSLQQRELGSLALPAGRPRRTDDCNQIAA